MPLWKETTVEVIDGSIVELEVDAIVNAANATLAGGGGVDGAIHRAAGPELKSACLALPELSPAVRCRPGEVKVTPGFALRAKHVLHTVGPVWRSCESGEEELLARCYRTSFEEAERLGVASLAFPAISTGAYGYPAHLAARVAASETKTFAARRVKPFRAVFAVLGVAMVRRLERALII
jgi:O-acetyl-ADP-ribose deacetylase (regulator of RNase III)